MLRKLLQRAGISSKRPAAGADARAAAKRALGSEGERLAAGHLERNGYRVLARNFVAPMGEVDLLARTADGRVNVLVEVKTRTVNPSTERPPPEAQITPDKARTLRALARHLARANRWAWASVRIDVIAIEITTGRAPTIRHHQAAVALASEPARLRTSARRATSGTTIPSSSVPKRKGPGAAAG
ncbi:MAG: YraN family protein [Phycisphaeraceae bacterium]|nr:YraN family protein [Phycisphaeraceae bacterium]